jgi:hypothetical protein
MHYKPPAFAVALSMSLLVGWATRIRILITYEWKEFAVLVELCCFRTTHTLSTPYISIHPVLLKRIRPAKAFESFE